MQKGARLSSDACTDEAPGRPAYWVTVCYTCVVLSIRCHALQPPKVKLAAVVRLISYQTRGILVNDKTLGESRLSKGDFMRRSRDGVYGDIPVSKAVRMNIIS